MLIDKNLNAKFSDLPTRGEILENYIAWTASHWSSHLGGIAHRW